MKFTNSHISEQALPGSFGHNKPNHDYVLKYAGHILSITAHDSS